MRFLTFYTPADQRKDSPDPDSMARMGAFVEATVKAKVLIATGSVLPSPATGMRLSLASGQFDIANTPAVSDRRQIGGWAILDVRSLAHLQEVTRQFLEVAGDGDVEVVEIMQMPISEHRPSARDHA
jgi:hypothetical protein